MVRTGLRWYEWVTSGGSCANKEWGIHLRNVSSDREWFMDDTGILPNTENPAGKTYEKKHNDIYYDLPVQLAGQAKGI